MEHSHEQDTINDRELGDQRRSKQEKEKITEEKGTKKAQKKLVNSIYFYQMYFSSACVKDDQKLVRKIVKELSSDAARLHFLHRNIGIRKIGFGGEFQYKYEITWSHNVKNVSVKELSDHLRKRCLSAPEDNSLTILVTNFGSSFTQADEKYI